MLSQGPAGNTSLAPACPGNAAHAHISAQALSRFHWHLKLLNSSN